MTKQIKPGVAAAVVAVFLVGISLLIYRLVGNSAPQYGAKIPDVVMKEFREKGPRPMPPMPMPGGRAAALPPGAVGAPPGAAGGK